MLLPIIFCIMAVEYTVQLACKWLLSVDRAKVIADTELQNGQSME